MAKDIRIFSFNRNFDDERSFKYQPPLITQARIQKLPNGGIKYQSDIALLFNEERLRETLGLDTLKKWINHFNLDNSNTGVDLSGMSDAQIMSTIKSRYIQAPCELKAWSEYLNTCAEKLVDEYNAELEKIKQAQQTEIEKKQQQQQQQQQNTVVSE